MRALFLVERNSAMHGSGLTSVFYNDHNATNHIGNSPNSFTDSDSGYSSSLDRTHATLDSAGVYGQLTPPLDDSHLGRAQDWMGGGVDGSHGIVAWMEIWDYRGGASFRAFMAGDVMTAEKSLFVFFDAHAVVGRDLKQALVALIELAEGPLECAHMTICIDRAIDASEAISLTKGLTWAGFSLTMLDAWTGGLDVTSAKWLFMGMEL
jgi:hypothetical protein